MATGQQSLLGRIARGIGRGLALVLVVLWTVLDQLLFPLFRPLITWLSSLRVFEGLGALLARLPPYVVLVTLVVPFVVLEPLKVFALYWAASGHVVQGLALLLFAHILSLFTLDRIYHSGRSQLMRIAWFARLMGWIVGLRDWAFAWLRTTAVWAAARTVLRPVRVGVQRLVGLVKRQRPRSPGADRAS